MYILEEAIGWPFRRSPHNEGQSHSASTISSLSRPVPSPPQRYIARNFLHFLEPGGLPIISSQDWRHSQRSVEDYPKLSTPPHSWVRWVPPEFHSFPHLRVFQSVLHPPQFVSRWRFDHRGCLLYVVAPTSCFFVHIPKEYSFRAGP